LKGGRGFWVVLGQQLTQKKQEVLQLHQKITELEKQLAQQEPTQLKLEAKAAQADLLQGQFQELLEIHTNTNRQLAEELEKGKELNHLYLREQERCRKSLKLATRYKEKLKNYQDQEELVQKLKEQLSHSKSQVSLLKDKSALLSHLINRNKNSKITFLLEKLQQKDQHCKELITQLESLSKNDNSLTALNQCYKLLLEKQQENQELLSQLSWVQEADESAATQHFVEESFSGLQDQLNHKNKLSLKNLALIQKLRQNSEKLFHIYHNDYKLSQEIIQTIQKKQHLPLRELIAKYSQSYKNKEREQLIDNIKTLTADLKKSILPEPVNMESLTASLNNQIDNEQTTYIAQALPKTPARPSRRRPKFLH